MGTISGAEISVMRKNLAWGVRGTETQGGGSASAKALRQPHTCAFQGRAKRQVWLQGLGTVEMRWGKEVGRGVSGWAWSPDRGRRVSA